MLKKYGIIIVLTVFIISLNLVLITYINKINAINKYNYDSARIYEQSVMKLKYSQDVYNDALEFVKQHQKIKEEEKKPKSFAATVPIFVYHFIRDEVGNYKYAENMLRVNSFKDQLKYISENGYQAIYISEFDKLYKYSKPIALTFDDGYEDFYINAFPLIKLYKVKVTLFVVNTFFGKAGYCNLNQLSEMKQSGLVDIESHTMTHPDLTTLNSEKLNYELFDSKEVLKEQLGVSSTVLSYPYGRRNAEVINKAKLYYKYAIISNGGIYSTDKYSNYEIPRVHINRSMTLDSFIYYLEKANVKVEW